MALSASGWKYISSSGATNPLGSGSPACPECGRCASSSERADSSGERCDCLRAGVFLSFGRVARSANVLGKLLIVLQVIGWSAGGRARG